MHRRALTVLAAVALLAGCTTRPAARPGTAPVGALPSAEDIVAALEQRRGAVRSLRAMARLSYASPEETRKAKQLVIAERPDRLRFEIFSPFSSTTSAWM